MRTRDRRLLLSRPEQIVGQVGRQMRLVVAVEIRPRPLTLVTREAIFQRRSRRSDEVRRNAMLSPATGPVTEGLSRDLGHPLRAWHAWLSGSRGFR
jgi:hypothetical protein